MARPPRIVVPGVPLHIVQRGNNRSLTFQCDGDFAHFRRLLREASQQCDCEIHAYVFMTNHVHLLVTPADARGPSRMMQEVGRRYVRYFNARYERTGTLWEGRYRSALVESGGYFFACSRYIELNPVRARIVARPDQYRWSSYRHSAQGETDELVTPHPLYNELGSRTTDRKAAYKALFRREDEPRTLEMIRRSLHANTMLGGEQFRERLGSILRRQLTRLPHGGDRRSEVFHRQFQVL